ncbi:cell division control protein 48 homolog C isoform X2 [Ziziphus jujuba]|uniref:Cell division control protein 48 homolog C isoform X2 n=1 Tax=Ziziphus jujuba TaxID=326968 RepID=A0ABM4ACW2_ZIZJJ|nr:cell division control protein 48 homolog C isoform X2 [Ziziphus jujuba]
MAGEEADYTLVIGATNRPEVLDPALRRAGRFETEILLGVPDENARADILSRKLPSLVSFDVKRIARSTPGFVPADLNALITRANSIALERTVNIRKPNQHGRKHRWWMEPWLDEAIGKLTITMDDIEKALKKVQPSSKREGFSTIPDVKWEDVGGLNDTRETFKRFIVNSIKYPEINKIFGGDIETRFLLFGPPGCGKTLIAKAVANEAGANFIYVKIDSLAAKRNNSTGERSSQRMVTQLLTELDGRDQRHGVFVIGATNK